VAVINAPLSVIAISVAVWSSLPEGIVIVLLPDSVKELPSIDND
jgi:hypothetical protein